MSFLNPAFLGALALGAIPILIHLIRRRKIRILPWAAWDFLEQSKRRNRRRLRIEQLLLLLLRILIVCLAVLALARPLWRTLALPGVAANANVHALILLDNSFSMAHRAEDSTAFERAQRVADRILARVLRQGDSVSVILASSRPAALIGRPTFDLVKARERVRTTRVSDRGTDFGASAQMCVELLRESQARTKEVYWITDNQASGLPDTGRERARTAWEQLNKAARLTWIDVSAGPTDNLSVAAPTFSRELVTPQAPVRIEAVIHNYSATPRKNVLVNMEVDGRNVGTGRVDLAARGSGKVGLVHLFDRAGVHTGSMRLALPDALTVDNEAYFAVQVRSKLKVLVVDPHPATDPSKDEAFYLVTALAPSGASEGASSAVQATVHPGSSLSGVDLRSYDAVVIADIGALDARDRGALQEFVGNGGGLLLLPGSNTDPARVNGSLGGGERFLPARLGPRRLHGEGAEASLNPASMLHPALAVFRDTSEIDLGSARFRQTFDLQPENGDTAAVVASRFSDGRPALMERKFGQGKVLLSAAAMSAMAGNFPFKPAFVPLVHQLTAYLAAGPVAQHNVHVGEQVRSRFEVKEAGKAARLSDPSGRTTVVPTAIGAEGVLFSYGATDRAGIYRVGLGGADNRDAFAVNRPADESDLTRLDEARIKAALGSAPVQFAHYTDDIASVVRRSRQGTEYWRFLIVATLVLLFAEALLARTFGRRG